MGKPVPLQATHVCSLKDARDYLEKWWLFGKPREELREATTGLDRFKVTGETSKHRFFEFFPTTIADNMIRVIASDDAYHLGVLSSHIHTAFSLRKSGWMGVGNDPRYQAECFSTFPFTPGILEEFERHLNSCVTFTRESVWKGRVPYVVRRYVFAGKPVNGFLSWVEQFRGNHQPIQDIADYLGDEFGIELDDPIVSDALDPEIIATIREYWKKIHQDRRGMQEGPFSINANELAEHDAEFHLCAQ